MNKDNNSGKNRKRNSKPSGSTGQREQSWRLDGTQAAGGQRAIYLGSVWAGHGFTTVWAAAMRTWWKECEERAVVAVARKLAVLLHRLWVTGEVYEPLRNHAALASVTTAAA